MYDTAEIQDVVVKEEPMDESEMDTEVLGTVHVMPTCYLHLRHICFSTSEEGEEVVADIGGGTLERSPTTWWITLRVCLRQNSGLQRVWINI